MEDLGALDYNHSWADFVSADGSVVVGVLYNSDNDRRAFRWNKDGGMQNLGTLGGNHSRAYAVSADGAVVVGKARTSDGYDRAFRWTEAGGDMEDLGTLGGDESWASAVSADGAVVVGIAQTSDGYDRAFRWTEDGGMQDLGTLGGDESWANAVSADGAVVVGAARTSVGSSRAFIWRTQMQDYENLHRSFPILSNDTEIAAAQQQAVGGHLMEATCLAEEGHTCLRVGGWLANTDSTASDKIGSRRSGIASLSIGRGISDRLVLGVTLGLEDTHLGSNSFDMDTGFGVSLWSEYSAGGQSRTGLQASAAAVWGRASSDITRGRGLDNVMSATGDADLKTGGVRATIGYGFQTQDWLITPGATLAYLSTRRDAYTETGADFNAHYDKLDLDRTTATLALTGERRMATHGTFSIGAGVEHDLSVDDVFLKGTSDMPGMDRFAIKSTLDRHKTRGFLDVGYTYAIAGNSALSGALRIKRAAYGDKPQASVGINYELRL